MPNDYAHSDLTLHGRFDDDGNHYRLFVLLNGVELPVQTLSVADYREKFEEANAAQQDEQQQDEQQPPQPPPGVEPSGATGQQPPQ